MNYLKKFESFQANEEIHKICKKYDINNYTINPDGSIDVDGDVNLARNRLKKLPLKFNYVDGYFNCSFNKLTTLEGAPQSVGSFACTHNKLTTLKGAPQSVGSFACTHNKLTTLKGAPQSVGGTFLCYSNNLTTLEGGPQSVSDGFICSFNKLTTLEGSPQSVVGGFGCSNNQLTSLKGGPQSVGAHFNCSKNNLTTLEGAPQSIDGHFDCSDNNLTTLKGAPQSVFVFICYNNIYLKSLKYLSKYIRDKVYFTDTTVYEIFKLFNDFSLSKIRYINDFKVIEDDKINLDMLNALLYDHGKPPVENVKGYINI